MDESQEVPQTTQRAASGRPPAFESRTAEFRRRLIAWKQMPESLRPSSRKLATTELNTTHQTLSYHLNRLDKWQAQQSAKRLRAEGWPFTAGLVEAMGEKIEELRRNAKRGPLNRHQVLMLKLFAKQGFSSAQEILQKCRQMTPEEEKQARALEQAVHFAQTIERIRREGESGPLCWQDMERLKYFARRKCVGAKELLEKYSKSALPRPEVPR